MLKTAIITGATGQIGSYFCEFLLNQDFQVYGTVRRLSVNNHQNIEHLKTNNRFDLIRADLNDEHSLSRVIEKIKPDYFINCAAISHTAESWEFPVLTMQSDCIAIINILEAIRKNIPDCRFANIGSTLELGTKQRPNEAATPYSAAKIAAHQIVICYRRKYNLFAVQPLISNSESPRRGEDFVTRKITKNIARIYYELQNGKKITPFSLGNIDTGRNFCHVLDIVRGIWAVLNQYNLNCCLKDYVICGDKNYTIRNFLEESLKIAGIEFYVLNGAHPNDEDKGKYNPNKDIYCYKKESNAFPPLVLRDKSLFRDNEDDVINLNNSDIKKDLKWKQNICFSDLVTEMVEFDILNYGKQTT